MDELRALALELAKDREPTPSNLSKVAGQTSVEAARWAFTQWELRRRARQKFARADELLFLREALEQATHEAVAAYHAERIREHAGDAIVADLTTGIGADLMALARGGAAIGFDLDSSRVELARHNLSTLGLAAIVSVGDSLKQPWTFRYAFADPARRVEGRRTLRLHEFSPHPAELALRMSNLSFGGMKLTPMLPDAELESLGPCLEFVSFGGECREALVWTGAMASAGRSAVKVEGRQRIAATEATVRETDEVGQWLFEADPAAIRAHAIGELGRRHGLKGLGDSNGYLTGEELVESPWLTPYRVISSGKGDLAKTRDALRSLGAAKPVLKQRGAEQDLQKLAKAFPAFGSRKVAVAIWAVGKSLRHTILALD